MKAREYLWTKLLAIHDPFDAVFGLVEKEPDPSVQADLLYRLLRDVKSEVSGTRMRRMTRLAESLMSSDCDAGRQLAESLKELDGRAAIWIRATLLERGGDQTQAARILDDVYRFADAEAEALWFLARARNLIKAGSLPEAVNALRIAARSARSYRAISACERLMGRLRKLQLEPLGKRRLRIALLGSSTLEFFVAPLRVSCFGMQIDAEIMVGGYGQYRQEILDPESRLSEFSPEVVVLANDWRDLGLPDEVDNPGAVIDAKIAELIGLWKTCRDKYDVYVIQQNFEIPFTDPYGRLSASLEGGRARVLRQLNLALLDAARQLTGVSVLDVDHVAGLYGKRQWSDPTLWHTAKQHPAPDALWFLARHYAGLLRAVVGLSSKVMVLDLDGTLWGGVIGEDGLNGIQLGGTGEGEAFLAFQRYVQSLAQRGIVLAVCSKNNEADAKLPFEKHPEMILSLEDIAIFVANWSPKDENLKHIAKTLNLGLDSLVFVDDSPTERSWIRRQLPQVEVPELPRSPEHYVQTVDEQMYFEGLDLTDEDRVRAGSYKANVERMTLETTAPTLEAFFADLRMRVELRRFDEADLPRIAQLVNKTNQFNLTTRRRSETQVRSLFDRSDCYAITLRVHDRFGDSGLTGVVIAFEEDGDLRVDTWLMSCRILGRRIEEVLAASLIRGAQRRGCGFVVGEYIPSAKNSQVRDLYTKLGFELMSEDESGRRMFRREVDEHEPEWPGFIKVSPASGVPD